ncbi:hypothetical protein BH11PSE5_BH11PSE5_06500 [soil metagenome]|nr:hypothetical protein Sbs19_41600 [Sphingobium sp. BS19]
MRSKNLTTWSHSAVRLLGSGYDVGERLIEWLSRNTSADRLLMVVQGQRLVPVTKPRVLGVAETKRDVTVLVDLRQLA